MPASSTGLASSASRRATACRPRSATAWPCAARSASSPCCARAKRERARRSCSPRTTSARSSSPRAPPRLRLAHRARLAGGPSRLRADLRGRHDLPAGLRPAPTLDAARLTGLKVGPTLVTVDARWLMAYAAALGETDPRYYDTRAHGGPLAHPLFSVCYEWPLALALRAKAMDEAIARRGVQAFHNLVVHRP